MKCLLKWMLALAVATGLCALLAMLYRQKEAPAYITLYDSDAEGTDKF